ncbi:MAG: sugar phosphate isomerase/epimerase [Clostridia bacterium]|nr:sugar phosphate isomerase/epimerase [Clostridia bacterium]
MVKLGMPTLIELDTIEKTCQVCSRLGLDFIELNMNLPAYQSGNIDIPRLRKAARAHSLSYTLHLDENLDVSAFNPHVAKAYRQTVLDAIELAKALAIPTLTMHLAKGVYFTLPDRKAYLYQQYRSTYLESLRAFREMCKEAIGPAPIRIGIDYCGFAPFHAEALGLLLQSPVFGLTFDVGHSHAADGQDEALILRHEEKLCHMHLHDALGKANHLALGDGEIDLPRYWALAQKHDLGVVLETKTLEGLTRSVEYVSSRL